MLKAKAYAFLAVGIVLVLFVVFVYLMTTVNPDPVGFATHTNISVQNPRKTGLKILDDYYDTLFPVPDNKCNYGLEKASESDKINASLNARRNDELTGKFNSSFKENPPGSGEADIERVVLHSDCEKINSTAKSVSEHSTTLKTL